MDCADNTYNDDVYNMVSRLAGIMATPQDINFPKTKFLNERDGAGKTLAQLASTSRQSGKELVAVPEGLANELSEARFFDEVGKEQAYEIKEISGDSVLVLSTTYESPLAYISEIEEDLSARAFTGKVLFDLLLCNGNVDDNRFTEATFEGGKIDRSSMKTIDPTELDDFITEVSESFYRANPLLLERNHILLDEDKRALLSETYSPTRQEFLQWQKAAFLSGDMQQASQIQRIGVNLRDLYRESAQDSEAIPPLDYSHPDVYLTRDDYCQMRAAISESESGEVGSRHKSINDPEQELLVASLIAKLDSLIAGEQTSIAGVKERGSLGARNSNRSDMEL